jgi:hypothetical protein
MTDTELLDRLDRDGVVLCFAIDFGDYQELIKSEGDVRSAALAAITLNVANEAKKMSMQ